MIHLRIFMSVCGLYAPTELPWNAPTCEEAIAGYYENVDASKIPAAIACRNPDGSYGTADFLTKFKEQSRRRLPMTPTTTCK